MLFRSTWPVAMFERILPRHLHIIYEINRRFLEEVGYLAEVPAKVAVSTSKVDAELASQAGPQSLAFKRDRPRSQC